MDFPFGDQDQATKTRKSEKSRTTRRRRSTWLPNESPQPMPALCTAGGPAEASVSALVLHHPEAKYFAASE